MGEVEALEDAAEACEVLAKDAAMRARYPRPRGMRRDADAFFKTNSRSHADFVATLVSVRGNALRVAGGLLSRSG